MGIVYTIRTCGVRTKRYEVWRSFDFNDGSPLRLDYEGSFDNYIEASERRKLCIEETQCAERKSKT